MQRIDRCQDAGRSSGKLYLRRVDCCFGRQLPSLASSGRKVRSCDLCKQPIIEIDYFSYDSDQLIGCIECNSWRGKRSAFIIRLSIEDIQALREGRQTHSVQPRQAIPVERDGDHARLTDDSA
jgi:hypothetical protein